MLILATKMISPLAMKSLTLTFAFVGMVALSGCNKPEKVVEKVIVVEKQIPAPAPIATATPHVYQLGEPRPIVLNDPNTPRSNNSSYLRELDATKKQDEADRKEKERMVANLQRDAANSRDQENKQKQAEANAFQKTIDKRERDAKYGRWHP